MMQEYTTNSGLFNVVNDSNQQARCKRKGAYVENKSKDLMQEGKSNKIHYVELYLWTKGPFMVLEVY